MTDRRYEADVLRLMRELYDTDPPDPHVRPARFPLTIERLLALPSTGRIVLFVEGDELRGYALLVPWWSNEWGGTVLLVDEIVVERAWRGRGVATAFFAFLERERPFDAVVLALEVSPRNARARALYDRLGFEERSLRMLTRALG